MALNLDKIIDINHLKSGVGNITATYCANLADAAAVCLDNQHHSQGITLKVMGDYNDQYLLYWPTVTAKMISTWADLEDAVEHGAYGLAFLLVISITGLTVIERSIKGTGFDYWIGVDNLFPFQNKARLEVSGILNGSNRTIRARLKEKIEQTKKSDNLSLQAYIVIVEFSAPISQVKTR